MESVHDYVCHQILELDNIIDAGKATSYGILKGKFAPKGSIGKIAREQDHEQCTRNTTRLKAEIKKKSREMQTKRMQLKIDQERTKRAKQMETHTSNIC